MITSLGIRYFKRFTNASFALRPLTVLTGLNGTGKSTTIQSLLLARQYANNPAARVVQLNGPYGLALGEAHEVLHPDAPDSCIEIALAGENQTQPSVMRFTVAGAMLKTCGSAPGRWTRREGRTFPNDPVMVTE